MSVVSIRLDPEMDAFFQERKIKVGPLAKDLLYREMKRQKFFGAVERLKASSKPSKIGKTGAQIIREYRDHEQ